MGGWKEESGFSSFQSTTPANSPTSPPSTPPLSSLPTTAAETALLTLSSGLQGTYLLPGQETTGARKSLGQQHFQQCQYFVSLSCHHLKNKWESPPSQSLQPLFSHLSFPTSPHPGCPQPYPACISQTMESHSRISHPERQICSWNSETGTDLATH